MQNTNTVHASTAPAPTAAPAVPAHWQPHTIPAEEFDPEPYTWYVREIGPWRLECFPPDESFDYGTAIVSETRWAGYAEFNETHEMRVEADSLAEAARLIEQMMATLLTSCLIDLVGGGLPDVAWETAIFLAEG